MFYKKFYLFTLGLMLLGSVAFGNPTRGGGTDSGGGDTERSSVEVVEAAATSAGSSVLSYLAWAQTGSSDQKIREIASRIISFVQAKPDAPGEVVRSLALFENRDFQFTEGECFDKYGNSKTGSAIINSSAPFCLSLYYLRLLPVHDLEEQLGPMMGHELSHQVGYEESDAVYFQNHLLRVFRNQDGKLQLGYMLAYAQKSIQEVLDRMAVTSDSQSLCMALGQAAGYVDSASRMGFVFVPSGYLDEPVDADLWPLSSEVTSLSDIDFRAFCGLPAQQSEIPIHPVPANDTDDLKQSLESTLKIIESIQQQLAPLILAKIIAG